MTEKEPQSLSERQMMEADAGVIHNQLGTVLRMEINARDFVSTRDGLMFFYGPHSPNKIRKIIIKLNGKDLYELEAGYMSRKTFDWEIVSQSSDIDAETLRDEVRRLVTLGLDV